MASLWPSLWDAHVHTRLPQGHLLSASRQCPAYIAVTVTQQIESSHRREVMLGPDAPALDTEGA